MAGNQKWSGDDLKLLLKQFGKHLVCLAGSYRVLNDNGEPAQDEMFYSYTGFVISTGDEWFIVTAGHVLKDLEEKLRDKRILITGRVLADYFGADAVTFAPIPFDVLEEPKVFVDDESLGLDVGVVHLREYYRNLLKANNVLPAPFRKEPIDSYSQFYGFSIVGFPDEKTKTLASSGDPQAGGAVMPVLVPIQLDMEAPTDDRPFPRLVGHTVDMGDLVSIVGISGGPMLGYRENGDETLYEVIGLQSRWLKSEKKTFGCPILPFLQLLAAKQQEMQAEETSGNETS